MHKLVILVASQTPEETFEQGWPDFLYWAERMPGVRREVTSRVAQHLYGPYTCLLIHELYFDTPEAARQALTSPEGTKAGMTLQHITQGKVTILLADHQEDSLENIRKSRENGPEQEGAETKGHNE